ncbi:30S ribosomal protein S4 [Tichowtungia aerotolerans]|uniref:Small ribosomal subunit protein uS4 n=1 Tax=Tichowtungia aerotolerans TaxID=2697043 RepID=A0A6P1M6K6_9BACT|nr:30S ribosomal protein S4 [Tichowtungia aerotolerans]QHI70429.1 30S ribosomal protein S4 [Tichowtungia aerotolerans]
MKYTGPKIKKSRRLGVALTPKAEKYLERRPHPPGQHGPSRRRGKLSDYGKQLIEKQRLQYQYNLSEKQVRKYYQAASRKQGNTSDILLQLIETRLDALVLRSGFARSIYQARQLVSHAHFRVNGKKCNIPSYAVRVGDVITVRDKSRDLDIFPAAQQISTTPEYLTVDDKKLTATLSRLPEHGEVPVQCEVSLVVEFYSR